MGARIGGNEPSGGEIDGPEARLAAADYSWKWIKMFSRSKVPFKKISR